MYQLRFQTHNICISRVLTLTCVRYIFLKFVWGLLGVEPPFPARFYTLLRSSSWGVQQCMHFYNLHAFFILVLPLLLDLLHIIREETMQHMTLDITTNNNKSTASLFSHELHIFFLSVHKLLFSLPIQSIHYLDNIV